jgi:hypothetical protein
MKFLSIFYHTITTHTHREPHALATPTVNFSSLGEKTGERRRIRKPDARARERYRERERGAHSMFPIRSLEDRHFFRRDTVQTAIDVETGRKGRGLPYPPPDV